MMQRTLLVTTAPERRRSWEALLRDDRAEVLSCAGPSAFCPLVTGVATCPLHDEVTAAVYDQDVVTPDFLVALLAAPPRIPIHFAIANGSRPPHIAYTLSGGQVRATRSALAGTS